jgi:hypothetical protein
MKKLILAFSMIALLTACGESGSGGCDYFTGVCDEPEYEQNYDDNNYYQDDSNEEAPYDGYDDNYDQDCADVGEEVWVGDDDPDGLDADGDGWGCEVWP